MASGSGRGDIPPEITEGMARLKTALGNASAYVGVLRDKVKAGLSAAEAASIVAGLNEVITGLDAISSDPTDPPPPPEFGKKK